MGSEGLWRLIQTIRAVPLLIAFLFAIIFFFIVLSEGDGLALIAVPSVIILIGLVFSVVIHFSFKVILWIKAGYKV